MLERACTRVARALHQVDGGCIDGRVLVELLQYANDDPNNQPTGVQFSSVPLGQITDQGVAGGDDVRATLTWAIPGDVTTATNVAKGADPEEDIGAAAHTNNAGKLSGMYYALQRASARTARQGRELIHTDSLYAMHMTTGRWMPRKKGKRNAPLIAKLRAMWRRIQRRRPGDGSGRIATRPLAHPRAGKRTR